MNTRPSARPPPTKTSIASADLLPPEHPRRLRGVEAEPGLRRVGDQRKRIQPGDDRARNERGLPEQRAPAQQPQDAENATAYAVQRAGRNAGDLGDRVVGEAHFLETTLECFGNVDEVRDLDQPVAGNAEPQPIAAVAELFVLALVDEAVIDAAAGQLHLRLLEQLVGREVDPPVGLRALLGDRARRRRVERRAAARSPAPCA